MSFHSRLGTYTAGFILLILNFSLANAAGNGADIVNGWIRAASAYEAVSLENAGVDYDPATGVTTVSDLKLAISITPKSFKMDNNGSSSQTGNPVTYKLEFPSIRFTNLAASDTRYSADMIEADIVNVAFDVDVQGQSTSSSGSYDGFSASNISWARPPEIIVDKTRAASSWYPLVAALSDISFTKFVMGAVSLKQTSQQPAMETIINYGAITMNNAVNGNIADVVADGFSISSKIENGSEFNVTGGPVTMDQYNMGLLVKNFALDARPDGSGKYTRIVNSAAYNDITIKAGGGQVNIKKVAMEDMGVRPTEVSLLVTLDRFISMATSGVKEPDPKLIADLVSSSYGAMRMGKFEVSGVSFDFPGQANGHLDSFNFGPISADGMGLFQIRGIEVNAKNDGYGRLGSYEIRDIRFPSLKALIGLEAAQRRGDIASIMQAIPIITSTSVKDLDLRIPGMGNFSIAENTINTGNYIGPIPTSLVVKITNLVFPVSMLEGEARQGLEAMGYDMVDVSYNLKAGWKEAANMLSLATGIYLKDGGQVDARVDLGGIPRQVFENPLTAQSIAPLVTLKSGSVTFDDRSIVDRGIKLAARIQKIDPEVMRQQVVGMVPMMLAELNNAKFTNAVTVAITTLLANRGSITASVNPDQPISIMGLVAASQGSPGALIDILNVDVKAQ